MSGNTRKLPPKPFSSRPSNYLGGVTSIPRRSRSFIRTGWPTTSSRIACRSATSVLTSRTFLPQAETQLGSNLTRWLRPNYQRLGSNYFADAKTPEEAKGKFASRLIRTQAMNDARKQALQFANVLFDVKPFETESLPETSERQRVGRCVSAPFNREDDPKDLQVGPDFTKAAFGLVRMNLTPARSWPGRRLCHQL